MGNNISAWVEASQNAIERAAWMFTRAMREHAYKDGYTYTMELRKDLDDTIAVLKFTDEETGEVIHTYEELADDLFLSIVSNPVSEAVRIYHLACKHYPGGRWARRR